MIAGKAAAPKIKKDMLSLGRRDWYQDDRSLRLTTKRCPCPESDAFEKEEGIRMRVLYQHTYRYAHVHVGTAGPK